jgi:hypothetical protein
VGLATIQILRYLAQRIVGQDERENVKAGKSLSRGHKPRVLGISTSIDKFQ